MTAPTPQEPPAVTAYRAIVGAHNFRDVTVNHAVAEECRAILAYIDALLSALDSAQRELDIEKACNKDAMLPAPCGHPAYLCHSEDGGKNIQCYKCELAAEKRRNADDEPELYRARAEIAHLQHELRAEQRRVAELERQVAFWKKSSEDWKASRDRNIDMAVAAQERERAAREDVERLAWLLVPDERTGVTQRLLDAFCQDDPLAFIDKARKEGA